MFKIETVLLLLSINVPILYGIFSIALALMLGVGAAIIRKFISDTRKKYKDNDLRSKMAKVSKYLKDEGRL